MSYCPINLLSTNTTSASVAKNWHENGIIEDVEKHIKELHSVLESVNASGLNAETKDFEKSLKEMVVIKNRFLAKWPKPKIREIKDAVDSNQSIPASWHQSLPLLQSRPPTSLTCLSNVKTDHVLFYKNEATGDIYKVVNIWYNQPNRCRLIEYSY